jgi:hypothetical protein
MSVLTFTFPAVLFVNVKVWVGPPPLWMSALPKSFAAGDGDNTEVVAFAVETLRPSNPSEIAPSTTKARRARTGEMITEVQTTRRTR